MQNTIACNLQVRITLLGTKKDTKSLVTLTFGPVTVGRGVLVGRWNETQVLAELKRNADPAQGNFADQESSN